MIAILRFDFYIYAKNLGKIWESNVMNFGRKKSKTEIYL